ncbi:MAG: hypothetical protein AABY15_05955 [Nanoarchaeota archaeon]
MSKTIINYCTSGLGNRLRSLASCYVISQETGRQFKIYWDNITPNGCLARFDELFENKIENISLEEMECLEDCAIVSEQYDAFREGDKFGRNTLRLLVNKFGCVGKDGFNYGINSDNIIVFNNNFIYGVDKNKSHQFIQNLIPTKEIQIRIDEEVKKIGLNKDIIGIHARGTDFGTDVSFYTNQIKNLLNNDNSLTFFLSTEDPEFEGIICQTFPGKILTANKKFYINKVNNNDSWQNHNNFYITNEHAKEAVLDIFLLSKTNIKVYHQNSTFCEIAKIISNK